jgi:hypothetical protein
MIGATGNTKKYLFCEPQECMVNGHWVRHQFLYVPEAPGPLLGRDLLSKLGTTVSMDLGLSDVSTLPVLTLEVSLKEEWCIHTPRDNKPVGPHPFQDHLMKWFLGVWDQDGQIGLATGHPPISITVKPGANLAASKTLSNTSRGLEGNHATHSMPTGPGNPEGIMTSLEHSFTPCQKTRVQ